MPGRVVSANECYSLRSTPRFDLFFASNGIPHVGETLKMNQAVNPVLAGETFHAPLPVLPDSVLQVACDSRVKIPRAAREDVNVVGLVFVHKQIPHRQGTPGFGMTMRASNSMCRTFRAVLRVIVRIAQPDKAIVHTIPKKQAKVMSPSTLQASR
jgi:hypothetical protein